MARETLTYFFTNPVGDLDGLSMATGFLNPNDLGWLENTIPATVATGISLRLENIWVGVGGGVAAGIEIWLLDVPFFAGPLSSNATLIWNRTAAPVVGADPFSLPDDNGAVLKPILLGKNGGNSQPHKLAVRTFGATSCRAYFNMSFERTQST